MDLPGCHLDHVNDAGELRLSRPVGLVLGPKEHPESFGWSCGLARRGRQSTIGVHEDRAPHGGGESSWRRVAVRRSRRACLAGGCGACLSQRTGRRRLGRQPRVGGPEQAAAGELAGRDGWVAGGAWGAGHHRPSPAAHPGAQAVRAGPTGDRRADYHHPACPGDGQDPPRPRCGGDRCRRGWSLGAAGQQRGPGGSACQPGDRPDPGRDRRRLLGWQVRAWRRRAVGRGG